MEVACVNLLQSMMEPCVMMVNTTANGPLGFTDAWTEGATFDAFVRKESAPELTIAEKQGVKETFTVVVFKGTPLAYHDVFKRIGDGAIFRLTSNVKDDAAPQMASTPVQIAKANCERWELT